MTRESPYRIHRELAETRQRPHATPQPPRRGLRVGTLIRWAVFIVCIAIGWNLADLWRAF